MSIQTVFDKENLLPVWKSNLLTETQSKNRSSEVYDAIARDILDGRHEPRARLRMDLLSEAHGVSLGAVREALVRLASDGLLLADPPKGFVVAPISRADLIDLTETRIELETRCLILSLRAGDLAWEGRVIGALHELIRTPVHFGPDELSSEWSRAHKAFHDALVSACDSRWRTRLREKLFLHAERYRRLSVPLSHAPARRRLRTQSHRRGGAGAQRARGGGGDDCASAPHRRPAFFVQGPFRRRAGTYYSR